MIWRHSSTAAAFAVAVSAVFSTTSAQADQPTVNVYNWSDYIAPDTIANFEKATGIKVNYDTYDSNETLEAKLAAGSSGYDIVVPTLTPFLARQLKAGFYQKLDKSKLPNWVHLDKGVLAVLAKYDTGNDYAVPWMTGTNGFGYNADKIKAAMADAPVDSLKLLFDPDTVAHFKDCGVSILDSPTEIFPAALKYLGLDPDSQKVEDLQKATDQLMKIRPYIKKFSSSEYINDLANGDVCLAWGYVEPDIFIAKRRADEAGKGVKVVPSNPKEGTERWNDAMVIPKDAPNPENALKFLNYIMQPEVIAEVTNTIFVRSGNADAVKFVKPEIANDKTIYPSEEAQATYFTISPATPEVDRARTRMWSRVKTGH